MTEINVTCKGVAVHEVVTALREQLDELRSMVEHLDEAGLAKPSACEGWSISDVLLHLAQTNETATASARGNILDAADMWRDVSGETVDDVAGAAVARERDGMSSADVVARWVQSADAMVDTFAGCDPAKRVRWVVGEMAARTLATTRIAETWIHTGDVAEGLGIDRQPSDRIWHIARLVYRTLPYAFERAGKPPPGRVRFELTAAELLDATWTFGDDDAATIVTGPALDLCRVAGQRATASSTALRASGPDATDVLALMRTFA